MRSMFASAAALIAAALAQAPNDACALPPKEVPVSPSAFRITSPAFAQGEPIPDRHAYRKQNLSPPLDITGVPPKAKCLALIVDDPDAPVGTWVHWLLADIGPTIKSIPEGSTPPSAVRGKNDFGTLNWGGPAPPSGTHRYFFRLYALDAELHLKEGFSRAELDAAMKGHIIATAEVMGIYAAR